MDMDKEWTPFAVDTEMEQFGSLRLCKAHNSLRDDVDFYRCRCEAIEAIQSQMRDPERQMVCDILANGKTFVKANAVPLVLIGPDKRAR